MLHAKELMYTKKAPRTEPDGQDLCLWHGDQPVLITACFVGHGFLWLPFDEAVPYVGFD